MTSAPLSGALTGKTAEAYVERRMNFTLPDLLQFPKYMHIETVSTCNARCIMCGIDFDKKAKSIMTDEMFGKIADEIEANVHLVEKVMPYLDGEPLIDKKIESRVRRLKQAGVKRVNISTNASLLTEDRARALIEAGLDEIYMSLDSLVPEVYEAIRVRLSFKEVFENILAFIRLRDQLRPQLMIRMQMIQQELNQAETQSFREFWRARLQPHDQIVIQRAHNWANAVTVLRYGDEDDVNRFPCQAIWGTMVVHVDGTVPLCCMDTESHHPLGQLSQNSIAEIWHAETVERYRRMHLDGKRHHIPLCDGCTLWREGKHAEHEMPAAPAA